MERTQKEYYLREQMKAIQTELGDREGKTGEIAELRKKIDSAGMHESTQKVALKELDRYESCLLQVQRVVSSATIWNGLFRFLGQKKRKTVLILRMQKKF